MDVNTGESNAPRVIAAYMTTRMPARLTGLSTA
jgi:hypothetical protein